MTLNLWIEPPGRLDDEHVVRARPTESTEVAAEPQVAARVLHLALLLPDEKQRRARPPLPPQHRVPAERPRCERLVVHPEFICRPVAVRVDDDLAAVARDGPHAVIPSEGKRA